MPRASQKVPNLAPEKVFEPLEHTVGQDSERVMSSTGPARESLEPALIQVVDRPVDNEKLMMLAFMEEPVTVHIHTTSDPNAEQVFQIFNNNQCETFKRNETKTVRRKFVDGLATRKITTFTQERRQDSTGTWNDVQIPSTALKYPFSVMHDAHPRGADWLKAVLAAA